MPKVEIEILRTVTIERDQNVVIEVDVPKQVLDDGEVLDFIDEIMEHSADSPALSAKQKAIHKAVTEADWETADETEEIEYNEAYRAD
jgi:hypothetical protein